MNERPPLPAKDRMFSRQTAIPLGPLGALLMFNATIGFVATAVGLAIELREARSDATILIVLGIICAGSMACVLITLFERHYRAIERQNTEFDKAQAEMLARVSRGATRLPPPPINDPRKAPHTVI